MPSALRRRLAPIAGGRFRRSLLGYSRVEVDAEVDELESELGQHSEALRAREAEVEMQSFELGVLRTRVEQCEMETLGLRSELSRARLGAERELRQLATIGRQMEEMGAAARGQATRIRLRALREAADLSARLNLAAGEAGETQRIRVLDALEAAIDRVGGEWEAEVPLSAPERPSDLNGAGPASERRRVSVDVGPFADFSQLVRFEDAANAIGATGDISIKRFSGGRARIDVALSEPVDLLRELEERCDLVFEVRSTGENEIVLDVNT